MLTNKTSSIVHVAVAVIEKNDQIFIARRPRHLHQGGLWEFPGGKVEKNETVNQALAREIREEIGIEVTHQTPLIQIIHHYPDKSVFLDVWRVTSFSGEPLGNEGQETRWVTRNKLSDFTFPEANKPIVAACQLPQHYLITPEPQPDRLDEFIENFTRSVSNNIVLAQLRAKNLSRIQLENLYNKLLPIVIQKNIELYVNCDLQTARTLKIPRVHLSSKELCSVDNIDSTLQIAASCHNANELEKAAAIGARFAVLSCVKSTESHPDTQPLGWKQFADLCLQSKIPVYALGGMLLVDTDTAIIHGAQGIAGISGFWHKAHK